MQATSVRARLVQGAVVAVFLMAPAGECLAQTYTQTCVHTPPPVWPPPHETCVAWTRGFAPIEDQDFSVDYDCAGCYLKPDVQVRTGDDTWFVWANDTSGSFLAMPHADLGAVTVDPGIAQSFTVTLSKPGTPGTVGVVNVGSAIMTPASGQYTSLKTGPGISGSFLGDISVVESGGSGGELDLVVIGDVDGDITASAITNLDITGDLNGFLTADTIPAGAALVIGGTTSEHIRILGAVDGDITIGTLGDSAFTWDLELTGPVAGSATITIAGFLSGAKACLNGWDGGDFNGRLDLPIGVPATVVVRFLHTFGTDAQSGAVIDLNGQDIVGLLAVGAGGWGDIINTGTLRGQVYLSSCLSADPQPFAGTATFGCDPGSPGCDPPTHSGAIHTEDCGGLAESGEITVFGDFSSNIWIPDTFGDASSLVQGAITVTGDVTSAGAIVLSNGLDAQGSVTVGGTVIGMILMAPVYPADLAGDVEIGGDLAGVVLAWGGLAGSGRILVHGLCSGEISFDEGTDTGTLIHVIEGLTSTGKITINAEEGDFNASGDIFIGDPTCLWSCPVTFDGSILVADNGSGSYGDLYGDITVRGCHSKKRPKLSICIEGTEFGTVLLEQWGCTYPVCGYECGGGPCF